MYFFQIILSKVLKPIVFEFIIALFLLIFILSQIRYFILQFFQFISRFWFIKNINYYIINF